VTLGPIATIVAACLGAATLVVGAPANASPSARLVYSRTPEASSCPAESALRDAVAARLGYDPFFVWAKRTVVVQVWRDRGKYLARLQLVDIEGVAHGTRTIASEQSCVELFDAAALAISIAIDSLPQTEPDPASTPTYAPAPAPESAPAPALESAPTPAPAFESAPAPESAPVPPPRFMAGLDVLGVLDSEPAPTLGLAALAGFDWRAASLSLELRADAPSTRNSGSGPGQVRTGSVEATLAPCARYGVASFCALGAIGLLYARSAEITDPRSAQALFVAVGARVQGDWPLSRTFAVRVHADGSFDLRRASLQIDGANAWTAPPFAIAGGAGIVAHFD
jgi:hypothetical protein